MASSKNSKDYLNKNRIPQLFECLMSGLLYHRPSDHLSYLHNCINKIREHGMESVKWDLFLEANKKLLPPISNSNLKIQDVNKQNQTPESNNESQDLSRTKSLRILASAQMVLVIGAPGSDKGYYCRRLSQHYSNVVHISIGNAILERLKSESHGTDRVFQQWKVTESLMMMGDLAPQNLVIDVLIDSINNHADAEIFLIDGYPRNMEQYTDLLSLGHPITFAFLIDYSEDRLRQKLLDDTRMGKLPGGDATSIARRLNLFKRQTLPLCKELEDNGLLFVVKGEQNPEDIEEDLMKLMESRLPVKKSTTFPKPPSSSKPGISISSRSRIYSGKISAKTQTKEGTAGKIIKDIPSPYISISDTGRKPDLPSFSIIFVMGGPGSGRSEQIKRLTDRYADYGVVSIDVGELARQTQLDPSRADQSWNVMASLVTQGEMTAEDIPIEQLIDALKKQAHAKCVFLEGYPRTVQQVEEFNEHIGQVDLVILLDCEEYYMTTRLIKRSKENGRIDDNMFAIGRKIRYFKEQTLPVVRHYDEMEKLVVVLGDRDSEEVFYDLTKLIEITLFKKSIKQNQLESDLEAFMSASIQLGASETNFIAEKLKESKVIFMLGGSSSIRKILCMELVKVFGVHHLSCKDLISEEISLGSQKAVELQGFLERQELIPLNDIMRLITNSMITKVNEYDAFVIDGFPRDLEQAVLFENDICACKGVIVLHGVNDTNKPQDDSQPHSQLDTSPVVDYLRGNRQLFMFETDVTSEEIIAVVESLQVFPKLVFEEEIVPKEAYICGKDGLKRDWPTHSTTVLSIFGGPCCGKSIQSVKLSEKYGYIRVSGHSEDSIDDILNVMKETALHTPGNNAIILLDDFPRDFSEALKFQEELYPCQYLIVLDVDEDVVRLRQNKDSNYQWDNYWGRVQPVVDHYQALNKVIRIDASGTIEEVFDNLCNVIEKLDIEFN